MRLSIYPDGGVARLRVHGEPVPDPAFLHGTIDLAALENGGQLTGCSDAFYSSAVNLIMPGRATSMADGWENARRRDGGLDYATFALAGAGLIRQVEIDTSYFVGNAPGWARLLAARVLTAPDASAAARARSGPDASSAPVASASAAPVASVAGCRRSRLARAAAAHPAAARYAAPVPRRGGAARHPRPARGLSRRRAGQAAVLGELVPDGTRPAASALCQRACPRMSARAVPITDPCRTNVGNRDRTTDCHWTSARRVRRRSRPRWRRPAGSRRRDGRRARLAGPGGHRRTTPGHRRPGARWVQLSSAGVELIGPPGCSIPDQTWTCAKGAYAEPVAEHALTLALAGLRGLRGRVEARSWGQPGGASLYDEQVTILGGGGISATLLQLLAPFRVAATVVRRTADPVPGAARTLADKHAGRGAGGRAGRLPRARADAGDRAHHRRGAARRDATGQLAGQRRPRPARGYRRTRRCARPAVRSPAPPST